MSPSDRKPPEIALTAEDFRSPVAITRQFHIFTTADTLKRILFEFRDAIRPVGDWISLLGLAVTLWTCSTSDLSSRFPVFSADAWQALIVISACLATLYLLVSVTRWIRRGCPTIDTVVDKLIKDSDRGYVHYAAKPPDPPDDFSTA